MSLPRYMDRLRTWECPRFFPSLLYLTYLHIVFLFGFVVACFFSFCVFVFFVVVAVLA